MKVFLFFIYTITCFADVDLSLEQFQENEDITAKKYNENYIKIHNELLKREYNIPFSMKMSGDIIYKEDLEKHLNDILNEKGIQGLNINNNEIKSDTLNNVFNKVKGHINNEFKQKSCIIDKSYSCNKEWDETSELYNWNFDCFPNYDKNVNIQPYSCNIKENLSFSISGKSGLTDKLVVLSGQRVYLSCSGSVHLGNSGGYNCANNSSAYPTSYRVYSGCTGGSPIFRTINNRTGAVSGYYCARNVYFENKTEDELRLQFVVNDSDRSNNSGSLSFIVVFQEQFL